MNWRVNALVIGPALMLPCSFPFDLSELPEKMLDGSKVFILLVDGVRVELTFYDMMPCTPQCYPPI